MKDLDWDCGDCGKSTLNEYFMLKHALWRSLDVKCPLLCIMCIERRLGRELTPDDFLDCPLNQHPFKNSSKLLLRRLGMSHV